MKPQVNTLVVSTPGRVCLFGEHQDYLGLPVIAAAISRRIYIEGSKRHDRNVNIDLPDLQSRQSFEICSVIPYKQERDYFRSGVNILQRHGFSFSNGLDCTVHGNIPINAGTSSSSAMLVGWTNFLSRMSDQEKVLDPEDLARYAYEAEVLEFSEPGGMMDQYSTSIGGLIWLESVPAIRVSSFRNGLGTFILGNSHQPKDTKYILANVKNRVLEIMKVLQTHHPEFSLHTISVGEVARYDAELDAAQLELFRGTILNRDITFEAKSVLEHTPMDHWKIGQLLNTHHAVLRDVLKISTPKIDQMIEAALDAGAYGAKINGSGGGGCMFAYAPNQPEKVAEAIRKVSDAELVTVDEGSKVDDLKESF